VEADWAAEVGAELPQIVVPWDGFIDLRRTPEVVAAIPEAEANRELLDALFAWNAPASPVFTSKCDVWTLDSPEIDPLEFDSDETSSQTGIACYVDLVARNSEIFNYFERHEVWARHLVQTLRTASIRDGRVDAVIRGALVEGAEGFALTVYSAGCGANTILAQMAWKAVLRSAVTATMTTVASCLAAVSLGASSSIG
jgi:hypothetical protein